MSFAKTDDPQQQTVTHGSEIIRLRGGCNSLIGIDTLPQRGFTFGPALPNYRFDKTDIEGFCGDPKLVRVLPYS